jgi:predicted nucleotidyltransferase
MDVKLKTEIVHFLTEKVSPCIVYLFGSSVKGTSNSNSDIDFAFLSNHDLDQYEIFMIAQQLADIVNTDVDLIDLTKASTVFQAQIVHTGKAIFCSDEKKRMEFEMKVLKMYAKLNEERQVITDRIEESGSIFDEK